MAIGIFSGLAQGLEIGSKLADSAAERKALIAQREDYAEARKSEAAARLEEYKDRALSRETATAEAHYRHSADLANTYGKQRDDLGRQLHDLTADPKFGTSASTIQEARSLRDEYAQADAQYKAAIGGMTEAGSQYHGVGQQASQALADGSASPSDLHPDAIAAAVQASTGLPGSSFIAGPDGQSEAGKGAATALEGAKNVQADGGQQALEGANMVLGPQFDKFVGAPTHDGFTVDKRPTIIAMPPHPGSPNLVVPVLQFHAVNRDGSEKTYTRPLSQNDVDHLQHPDVVGQAPVRPLDLGSLLTYVHGVAAVNAGAQHPDVQEGLKAAAPHVDALMQHAYQAQQLPSAPQGLAGADPDSPDALKAIGDRYAPPPKNDPKDQAEIEHIKAQTAEAYAAAGKNKAESNKAVKEGNSFTGGVTSDKLGNVYLHSTDRKTGKVTMQRVEGDHLVNVGEAPAPGTPAPAAPAKPGFINPYDLTLTGQKAATPSTPAVGLGTNLPARAATAATQGLGDADQDYGAQ